MYCSSKMFCQRRYDYMNIIYILANFFQKDTDHHYGTLSKRASRTYWNNLTLSCRWRVEKTPVRRDFSCQGSGYNNRTYTINNKIKPREHKSAELTQKTKQTENTTQKRFLSWDRIRMQRYKQRRKQNTYQIKILSKIKIWKQQQNIHNQRTKQRKQVTKIFWIVIWSS